MPVSINHNNVLSELPFYNLDPQEFLKITGGWVHHSYHSLIESKDLFRDIIASLEKERDLQENPYNSYIQTIILSNKLETSFIRRISTLFFSMMHFNIRSPPKDLTSLNDLILTVKETPEIIAISETKLQDENIYNISIPGYVFLNTNSPTRAGGVGLYISL